MAHTMRSLTTGSDIKGACRPGMQRMAAPCIPSAHGLRTSRGALDRQQTAGASAAAVRVSSPRNAQVVRVAAQEAPTEQAAGTQTWYALVASAEFFCNDVQNEPLAEQLRERVRYFKEQGRETDFYLVPNPTWLDARFGAQAKQVRRPSLALVSTDKQWIVFMKLRLDRVLKFDLVGLSEEEVLSAGEALPEFPKPDKWTAPYSMYAPKWWEVFFPGAKP